MFFSGWSTFSLCAIYFNKKLDWLKQKSVNLGERVIERYCTSTGLAHLPTDASAVGLAIPATLLTQELHDRVTTIVGGMVQRRT